MKFPIYFKFGTIFKLSFFLIGTLHGGLPPAQNAHVGLRNIKLSSKFNQPIEISGMAVYKDTFFLIAEKQELVYVMCQFENIDSFYEVKPPISLKIPDSELEGVAVYKEHLMLTDEKRGQVLDLDLRTGAIMDGPVKIEGFDLSNDRGLFGIEGIAVNQQKGVCYIAKERNANYQIEVKQFKIKEDGTGKIMLKYERNTLINNEVLVPGHPEKNWRYADIYFDEKSNTLYAIRSSFLNGKGRYFIDSLPCSNQHGLIMNGNYGNGQDLRYSCLTEPMREFASENKSYHTNLEGLTIYKDHFYLVSDNYQVSSDDGKKNVSSKIPGKGLEM